MDIIVKHLKKGGRRITRWELIKFVFYSVSIKVCFIPARNCNNFCTAVLDNNILKYILFGIIVRGCDLVASFVLIIYAQV